MDDVGHLAGLRRIGLAETTGDPLVPAFPTEHITILDRDDVTMRAFPALQLSEGTRVPLQALELLMWAGNVRIEIGKKLDDLAMDLAP